MSKPVIGITTPRKRWNMAYFIIKFAVWLAGGRPLPLKEKETVESETVDGLVIGGGTDVFPGLYNDNPKEGYPYDLDRDEMEIGWLSRARNEDIPVLGICRGAQIMNVMNGGTLHMDVSIAYENAHYPKNFLRKLFFRKGITLVEGSRLSEVIKTGRTRVNSMHEQSIKEPGRGLDIVAQEDNGVVQGIERPGHPYYIGVQFHPEFLVYRRSMRNIFRELVRAAA